MEKNITLAVSGMSCGHCVASVKQALATVPGIADAQVSVGAVRLTVAAESPQQVAADAVSAIQRAGYNASTISGASGAA